MRTRSLMVFIALTFAGSTVTTTALPASRRQQNQSVVQPPFVKNTATFEVVSVKPNRSGGLAMNLGRGFKGGTYTAANVALRNVIALAYGIPIERVLGGPEWIGAASTDLRFIGGDRFDLSATLPQGSSVDQVPAMLRALLADRFKMVVHNEVRAAPIYALVVARRDGRLGPQLNKASIDCDAAQGDGTVIPAATPGQRGPCDLEVGGTILGRGQRITALARMLSMFADRPVADRTGLIGGFDFDLRFPELDTPRDAVGPRADPATGIFTALQEQLGLKLESTRGELEFVIIENVQHPTDN
jgi:uncharacterized protein (TIGR03435 family)